MMLSTQEHSVEFGIAIGEEVRILSGPLEKLHRLCGGTSIPCGRSRTVKVKMFLGREMPVEVGLEEVTKV